MLNWDCSIQGIVVGMKVASGVGGNAQKKEKERVVYLRKRPMTCCVFKPHMMVMFSKFPAHGNERLIIPYYRLPGTERHCIPDSL